ncbi:MAG: alcohol dehydrogenase catalytic domain-containing protein [Candidatus Hydrogenedentes bacterium]|nr:alcohol dehydrogenase catalytic domain-containing protein [Candidatus Hydrogenedentota bacterium]
MKALLFDTKLHLEDIPIPVPATGEALVRVSTAGICNTDIEICRGYMNYSGILGHEFVGVVEEASNSYMVGKRVVGEINCVCEQCRYCKMEMPNHCQNRSVLGILNRPGVFAEYVTLPEKNLHIVPDALNDEMAVFTEPLAAAFRITEQVSLASDDRIFVLGDGKLGQLISQTLWLYSKNIICLGKHQWKLDMLSSLGIDTAIQNSELAGNADIVVDATGSSNGLHQALSLVRPEGTVLLKTTCVNPLNIDSKSTVINEVRILGSRCGPFRPALEALALGTVETRPLVTESYPLVDAIHAMSRAEAPGVMKVLLHI